MAGERNTPPDLPEKRKGGVRRVGLNGSRSRRGDSNRKENVVGYRKMVSGSSH